MGDDAKATRVKTATKKPRNKADWPYLFLTVSGLGLCGKVGKVVRTFVSYGWKRRIGDKHKPLATLFVPLLQEAAEMTTWPSESDMLADFRLIRRWAQRQLDDEAVAAKERSDGR